MPSLDVDAEPPSVSFDPAEEDDVSPVCGTGLGSEISTACKPFGNSKDLKTKVRMSYWKLNLTIYFQLLFA